MRILAISGSLQSRSSNTALLQVAVDLAPTDVEIAIYDGIRSLPHFNPDLERDVAPSPVVVLRREVQNADAVLIATPEYAHAIPGALKNALDWLVGSGELYGKRVAVLCASPRLDGGVRGRRNLEQTLTAQGAEVIASGTLQVLRADLEAGIIRNAQIRASITAVLARLAGDPDRAGPG